MYNIGIALLGDHVFGGLFGFGDGFFVGCGTAYGGALGVVSLLGLGYGCDAGGAAEEVGAGSGAEGLSEGRHGGGGGWCVSKARWRCCSLPMGM